MLKIKMTNTPLLMLQQRNTNSTYKLNKNIVSLMTKNVDVNLEKLTKSGKLVKLIGFEF